MTAMVAGGLISIVIQRVTHIADNALMFIYFIAMAVKCPHRSVSEDAGDEPYHEKAFEHHYTIHNIN
jgi:hypothetical protein